MENVVRNFIILFKVANQGLNINEKYFFRCTQKLPT